MIEIKAGANNGMPDYQESINKMYDALDVLENEIKLDSKVFNAHTLKTLSYCIYDTRVYVDRLQEELKAGVKNDRTR